MNVFLFGLELSSDEFLLGAHDRTVYVERVASAYYCHIGVFSGAEEVVLRDIFDTVVARHGGSCWLSVISFTKVVRALPII